jgi:hypothetical protein
MEPSGRNWWQPVANATAAKRLNHAKTLAIVRNAMKKGLPG